MIVCTILNLFIKSGSKAVGPLQAMGYDKSEDVGGGEEQQAPQTPEEAALRFRIMQAGFNRLAAAKKVE